MVHDANIVSVRIVINKRMVLSTLIIGAFGSLFTALLTYIFSSHFFTVIAGLVFGITLTVLVLYFYIDHVQDTWFQTDITREQKDEEDFQSIMKVT